MQKKWGHEAKMHEAEATTEWGRGQPLWGRGHTIWPRGRADLEALTSLLGGDSYNMQHNEHAAQWT